MTLSSSNLNEIGDLYENTISNQNEEKNNLNEDENLDWWYQKAGRLSRQTANLIGSTTTAAAKGALGEKIPANRPWWDRWANYAGNVQRSYEKQKLRGADQFIKGFTQKPSSTQNPPVPPKPKPTTQPKTDPKGVQLEATTTIVAPRGGRVGTQEPGKPKTWKPITRSNDPRIAQYKKARGAEQLKADKQLNIDVAAMNRQTAATPPGRDPETYRPPAAPDRSTSLPANTRPPAATKPAPTRQAPAPAQTGDRTKDLSTWAKANEPMISKVGTPQQRAILAAAKSGSAMPAPRPISKDIKGLKDMQKDSQQSQASQRGPMYSRPEVRSNMSSRTKTMLGLKDSYDIVLDYLFSQGHVDTLEEAHYVMLQMDSKCIQDIVSEQSNTLITPEQRRADELKYGMKRTTAVPPSKPGGTKQKPGSRMPL